MRTIERLKELIASDGYSRIFTIGLLDLMALIAAAEALEKIVALDDGDKPDLWHFEEEFKAGRAALDALK